MYLYPRLPLSVAGDAAAIVGNLSIENLLAENSLTHPSAIYSPVGGTRVSENHLRELQVNIRRLARKYGYPFLDSRSNEKLRSFDSECAGYLHENMKITPHEASQASMWAFIACVLLPDVVRWRFPGSGADQGTNAERFVSRERNTFGRLWWRAFILKDETSASPYELISLLNEDEIVQIMERPKIAGNRVLVISIVRTFLDVVVASPASSRMHLMRGVQKRLSRIFPIIAMETLTQTHVQEHLNSIFMETLKTLPGEIANNLKVGGAEITSDDKTLPDEKPAVNETIKNIDERLLAEQASGKSAKPNNTSNKCRCGGTNENCNYCCGTGYKYSEISGISHNPLKLPEKPAKEKYETCLRCGKKVPSQSMKTHMARHDRPARPPLVVIDKNNNNITKTDSKSNNEMITCECGAKVLKKNYEKHKKKVHFSVNKIISTVENKFVSISRVDNKIDTIKCISCSREFKNKQYLDLHFAIKHVDAKGIADCVWCNDKFDISEIDNHIKIMHNTNTNIKNRYDKMFLK